jgi:Flp pilus assembly protein TadG
MIGPARATARHNDGSMTVELIVLAPMVVLFAILVLGLGRYELARQRVTEATFAAAQAASLAPSAGQAQMAAQEVADSGLNVGSRTCSGLLVTTDVTAFGSGGMVTVELECHVDRSDLLIPGIAGSASVQSRQVVPLDPYRVGQ